MASDNGLSGIHIDLATPSGLSYLAAVSIVNNRLGTDASGTSTSGKVNGGVVPFGNALDGVLVDEVLGVTIGGSAGAGSSQANVISGNLNRGIEVRGDRIQLSSELPARAYVENWIESNLIGTDSTGTQVADQNTTSLGNLSDGIFLYDPGLTDIQDNVVSDNRGSGIHAQVANASPVPAGDLTIADNMIGVDITGNTVKVGTSDLGNGSDGIFLDSLKPSSMTATTAPIATIEGNEISGNHANGVNVLKSADVLIEGNKLGTNRAGFSAFENPTSDFGNAADGVFLNQSSEITIGGSTAAGNLIAGNHGSGIFVSGTSGSTNVQPGNGSAAAYNLIAGNQVGVNGRVAVLNAVAGIILSNADNNTIGGASPGQANVISGNALDGILLVNEAQYNLIAGNAIGTDGLAGAAIGNSADGVLLLGVSTLQSGQTVTGSVLHNTISGNVISGNNENGLEIFGAGSSDNVATNNTIGLGAARPIANHADGVLANDAGTGNVVGPGNVISGNVQSGVGIVGSTTDMAVIGNLIGTDPTGLMSGVNDGNGGNGVVIYGASGDTIGGTTATKVPGTGNTISGNAQAGVQIFSPGGTGTTAGQNLVVANLIGTDKNGSAPLPNGSDGVQIIDGSFNTIGGPAGADRNVISGNAGNGIFIDQFPTLAAINNQVLGNFIGTNAAGSKAIANQANGVLITDGSGNAIGAATLGAGVGTIAGTEVPTAVAGDGAGNLISGNDQWGIQILLSGNSLPANGGSYTPYTNQVLGNFIGTDVVGNSAIANTLGGVLVNDLSTKAPIPQVIGGTSPGSGNLISGNADIGIELLGPQGGVTGSNNTVQGNLIGLNALGAVLGEGTGVFIDNSPNNLIGGTTTGARNVISGNSQAGIHIFDALSTEDSIEGNLIGTDLSGSNFPSGTTEASPPQSVGVLIDGSSGDSVGGTASGAGNVISGNGVGIQITGVKQNNGQIIGSGNMVEGNLIGTDSTGTQAVSNLDLGVFIDNSRGNVVGPGNDIAANGIAGVEILGDASTGNLVAGNTIGLDRNGAVFSTRGSIELSSNGPEPGILVESGNQLNGVVILGASQNTVGVDKAMAQARPTPSAATSGLACTSPAATTTASSTRSPPAMPSRATSSAPTRSTASCCTTRRATPSRRSTAGAGP